MCITFACVGVRMSKLALYEVQKTSEGLLEEEIQVLVSTQDRCYSFNSGL